MSDYIRIFRPMPTGQQYEWVVVEDGPSSWQMGQAIFWSPARRPGDVWPSVRMDLVTEIHGRRALRAKVPWEGNQTLVLRDEAIDSLSPILAAEGELLPLECDSARLIMFTAGRAPDESIVEERSRLPRKSPLAEHFEIEHIVLDGALLRGRRAFEIHNGLSFQLLLQEDLVAELEATGDTDGISFESVGYVERS